MDKKNGRKNLSTSESEKEKEKETEKIYLALTPLEKGAILLSSLGKGSTTQIFKHMKDNDVRRTVEAMANVEKIPVAVVKRVLQEFFSNLSEEKDLLFGHLHNNNNDKVSFLHDLVGKERSQQLWGKEQGAGGGLASLDALEGVDNGTLAMYLVHEHPQTVALILTYLDPVRKSDVFGKLPERMQAEVLTRMGKLDAVSPASLQQLNEVLKRELLQIGPRQKKRLGGTQEVATLLNAMDRNSQKKILDQLSQKNAELTAEIREHMFTFEDLIFLQPPGLQTVVSLFQGKTLAVALKTASPELKNKFFQQMSKRAATILQEDILALGPTRLSEVQRAQQDIIEKVQSLCDQGKLHLQRGAGPGDQMV